MVSAKTYGESLYSLAKEQQTETEILSELKYISDIFTDYPDYVKILDSYEISLSERIGILDEDFSEKVNMYTLNFLKILCEKHIVHYIKECFDEYEHLYDDDNGIRLVTVTTAKPISKETLDKLVEKLERKRGGKFKPIQKIDESCIGGIIIETDNMRIDASVKTELDNMKKIISVGDI